MARHRWRGCRGKRLPRTSPELRPGEADLRLCSLHHTDGKIAPKRRWRLAPMVGQPFGRLAFAMAQGAAGSGSGST